MTRLPLFAYLLLLVPCVFASFGPAHAQSVAELAQPQLAPAHAAGAMVVYVSDFDLDVVRRKPFPKAAPRASPPAGSRRTSVSPSGARRGRPSASASDASQSPDSSDGSAEETPADQATALINAVSENIIRALAQAGYDVRRLSGGEPLPRMGMRIRGVFAEGDERNRARRLLIGGEPVSPNMILFVGVNNLSRPEQPLYELAYPPINDSRHGPVITVTPYTPAQRFELSRDPSGDELMKVAAKIAADLTALVNINRLSLPQ